jgi:UDP-glucuronate 4-epimerase
MSASKILVTGTAGFIGFYLAKRLLPDGSEVVGLNNINDYYDVRLKYDRLRETGISSGSIEYGKLLQSAKYTNYRFVKADLEDRELIENLFVTEKMS